MCSISIITLIYPNFNINNLILKNIVLINKKNIENLIYITKNQKFEINTYYIFKIIDFSESVGILINDKITNNDKFWWINSLFTSLLQWNLYIWENLKKFITWNRNKNCDDILKNEIFQKYKK